MRRFILPVGFVLGLGLFVACGSSAQPSKATDNNAVRGSVQQIEVDGSLRRYVCFTYTTEGRGGIWCERVGANP